MWKKLQFFISQNWGKKRPLAKSDWKFQLLLFL
jgi:hypothetical protein